MTSGLKGLAGLPGLGVGAADQPEIATYISNVAAVGGSVDSANRALLNQLIASGKADGWLSTIQRWFFPSGSNSAAALNVPLIDTLALGNFVSYNLNSSHWAPSGLQGASGANRYVDSLYVPSTHLASANSCCVTTHVELENLSSRQFQYPRLYAAKNSPSQWLQVEQNNTSYYSGKMFSNTGSAGSSSSQLSSGDIILNRVSSTSLQVINNGSVVASNSTPSSGTLPTIPIFIFAENNAGTPGDFSYSRILSWAIGSGMNGSQLSSFASAIAAYKAAKGI